jgi:hypothetical protein
MFRVDATTAEGIRQVLEESGGEMFATIELRAHFPWSRDNAAARRRVTTIANWKPLSPLPRGEPEHLGPDPTASRRELG